MYKNDHSSLLHFNSVKIYIDGILDLDTALLLKPYDELVDPNYPSGFSYFKTDQLNDDVEQLSRMGYRAHFHVIGDKAVRLVLDSIEALSLGAPQARDAAHRTSHTYMVNRADMPRFAE